MNKQGFLNRLRQGLAGIPQAELDERLMFYSEMIEDRMEEGLSEEEAVATIGSVEEIIGQILEEHPSRALAKDETDTKKRWGIALIVLLLLGSPIWLSLLISAFSAVLSVYVSLWAGIIALWASLVVVVCAALGLLVGGIYFIGVNPIFTSFILIGAGLACIGVSILFYFGCKLATKVLIWLTKLPVQIIKNAIARKGKAV